MERVFEIPAGKTRLEEIPQAQRHRGRTAYGNRVPGGNDQICKDPKKLIDNFHRVCLQSVRDLMKSLFCFKK